MQPKNVTGRIRLELGMAIRNPPSAEMPRVKGGDGLGNANWLRYRRLSGERLRLIACCKWFLMKTKCQKMLFLLENDRPQTPWPIIC